MKKTVRTAAAAMLAAPLIAAVFAAPASADAHGEGTPSSFEMFLASLDIIGSIDTASMDTLNGSIDDSLGSADNTLGSADDALGSLDGIFGSSMNAN
ncbi:hypothetical protein [Rhodococcus spongiicola]|nr:hypothetical protein [Rhodococcus spongiicola]